MTKWSRREFLGKSLKGTAGLLAMSALPLGLAACNKSDNQSNNKPLDVGSMANLGPLSELEKGEFPKKVDYKFSYQDAWVKQEQAGFVYINKNKNDNSLLIMSPICTHLGCTAGFAADQGIKKANVSFFCPCHGGEYDAYGINVAGPPPRPLDIFEPVIKDGNVYISVFNPIKRENNNKS